MRAVIDNHERKYRVATLAPRLPDRVRYVKTSGSGLGQVREKFLQLVLRLRQEKRRMLQLREVTAAQPREQHACLARQPQPHHASVPRVALPLDKPHCLGPANQANSAVMPDAEGRRHIGHTDPVLAGVGTEHQEQLVLLRGQARVARFPVAPQHEFTNRDPKGEQRAVLRVGEIRHGADAIRARPGWEEPEHTPSRLLQQQR